MTTDEKNFHNMLHTVVRARSEHRDVTTIETATNKPGCSPAIARAFDGLVGIEARINHHRRKQDGVGLEIITAEKETLQRITCQTVAAVGGILQAFGAETQNTILRDTADTAPAVLLRLGDETCVNRCTEILALITEANRATLRTDYLLTEALENTARDLLEEFATRIGAPRAAKIAFSDSGEQIRQAITEARELLTHRLDPQLRSYTLPTAPLAHQAFAPTYTAARVIVDLKGKRRKKKDEAPGNGGGI